MAPKQRQIRMEQRGGLEAIQALEQRSEEDMVSLLTISQKKAVPRESLRRGW